MAALPRRSSVSRRALLIFVGVTLFTCAELGWWIVFNMQSTHERQAASLAAVEHERRTAADLIALVAQHEGARPQLPATLISTYFPDLQWHQGPFVHEALNSLYPNYGVFVQPSRLSEIYENHDRHVRMFRWEGGTFIAFLLLGIVLIFRTMEREVSLTRQQGNFVAAVTHELKSPLASLRLYTETMELRDPPQETRLRYLTAMRQDIDRLETLVGNLLAVARLDAGQFVVHPERTDLVREARALVKEMQQELQDRGSPVEITSTAADVWTRIDAGVLRTILRNLLDNAAKYSGKPVRLHLAATGKMATVSVIDMGIGIAPEEQAKIFHKFYRVGDEMVRQAEGSGLGLYLVHALVQESGGEVSVESAGPGLGSTFHVRLPRDTSEAP